MNYQVLALKWRPKNFKDLIGQEHVAQSIQNSIKLNKLGHSYLLTGTRGVGKTSLARIFAKSINCLNPSESQEPCLECVSCKEIDQGSSLNYLEVDGASNNGVENIRSLIESLQYLPTQGRYRVAVIDEVHMLSTSAFNALLKTLEEPPEHVIFIFATTNPEKIPDTVLSRCLRFDLKSLSLLSLQEIVERVSREEGIKFSSAKVSESIAKYAKGSVRDSLTLLEQLKSFANQGEISLDHITQSLGLAKTSSIDLIVNSLIKEQVSTLTESFEVVLKENVDLKQFCEQILSKVFDYTQLALQKKPESFEMLSKLYLSLSKDFSWMLSSLEPESLILMSLQKHCVLKNSTEKKNTKIEKPPFKFHFEPFLDFLKEEKPASAANLQLGNVLKLEDEGESFLLQVGFSPKSAIMFDYFQEKDIRESVLNALKSYLKVNQCVKQSVELKFELCQASENFKSVMDIYKEKEEKAEEEIIKEFKDSDIVKHTEKIFGKEITEVRLIRDF